MHIFKVIDFPWTITETTKLFGLKLLPGGSIIPPEGKLLTMTFNGTQVEPVPGVYEGDIVLTLTDPINTGKMAPAQLKAGLYIGSEGPNAKKSVLSAVTDGVFGDSHADGIRVTSLGDCFSAVCYDSDKDYTINDMKIDFVGSGNNESVGEGAGIVAGGSGTLTLNRADIRVRGAARSAIFNGGDCKLVVNDSRISSTGGVLPPDYEDSIAAGRMKRVPWMLGLRGNSRTTNVAERSVAEYNRCVLTASEWGVMSTDGVEHCRLTMNDCEIKVTGKSGYGTFALLDTVNTLNHCTVEVPDYALICANGPASGVITGATAIYAGRFGVMSFRNTDGVVTVDGGSRIDSGEACFMVKGCSTRFAVDDAILHPANGVILQVMDTDDPRNPRKYFSQSTEADDKNPERDIWTAEAGRDVIADFSNMTISGAIFNSTTNLHHDTGPDMGDPHGPPPLGGGAPGPKPDKAPEEQAKNLMVTLTACKLKGVISASTATHFADKIDKENCEELGRITNQPSMPVNNGVIVNVGAGSRWEVDGTCYLSLLHIMSGGQVLAADGKTLVMEVNGNAMRPQPGCYRGLIKLEAK